MSYNQQLYSEYVYSTDTVVDGSNYVQYEIIWKSDGGMCMWWGPPPTEVDSDDNSNLEGPGDIILMYDKESKQMRLLQPGLVAPAWAEKLWD
jgi:hypothetical protein